MRKLKKVYKPKERNRVLLSKFYEETKKEIYTRQNNK